jgi:hypothetical protein
MPLRTISALSSVGMKTVALNTPAFALLDTSLVKTHVHIIL